MTAQKQLDCVSPNVTIPARLVSTDDIHACLDNAGASGTLFEVSRPKQGPQAPIYFALG